MLLGKFSFFPHLFDCVGVLCVQPLEVLLQNHLGSVALVNAGRLLLLLLLRDNVVLQFQPQFLVVRTNLGQNLRIALNMKN